MSELARRLRRQRGLSQAELAEAVGVSRQAIAGIEAGAFEPSLAVALRLARFFGVSVEELFDEVSRESDVPVELVAPARAGERLEVAEVASRLVAVPRGGERGISPGFHPAGARLSGIGSARIVHRRRRAVVVAGCDPALALLAGPLAHRGVPFELVWWPASSAEALEALARGQVHLAGFHVALDGVGRMSLPDLGPEVELRSFATWREGLLARGSPPRDLQELLRVRLANRQVGAEARELLAAHLRAAGVDPERISGWHSEVGSHLMVAEAVATGVADTGVALEPAAREFGLGFVPLAHERFVLALPREPAVGDAGAREALEEALASDELRRELAALPGYHGLEDLAEPLVR